MGRALERVGLKTAAAHALLSCPGPRDPGPSQGSAQEPGGKGWAPPRWNRPQEAEIFAKAQGQEPTALRNHAHSPRQSSLFPAQGFLGH